MKHIQSAICIIGAGPAGAATSIFLSKLGIEHLILDAAEFPRNKVCGDGLDLRTIRMLNHIDPNIIPNEIVQHPHFAKSWGTRAIAPNGKQSNLIYQPEEGKENQFPFLISKRFHFDHFLVNKIDKKFAHLLLATKVTNIVRDGKQWKVFAVGKEGEIEIESQLLIGADGDHSVLLRHLGERKINRHHYAGSVRQYWHGIEGVHEKNLLEIYYPKDLPMSYFWIFPLPNGEANVGYGMVSELAAKHNVNIRKQFSKMIETDAAIAYRFKNAQPVGEIEGWGLPLASLQRNLAGDGYLLTGDAGSMISPSNGEGIGNAMLTGYIAAQFIQHAIQRNDFSQQSFVNYNREVYRSFHGEIKEYNFYLKYIPDYKNKIYQYLIRDNWAIKNYFQHKMKGWLNTAYEKKVIVNV